MKARAALQRGGFSLWQIAPEPSARLIGFSGTKAHKQASDDLVILIAAGLVGLAAMPFGMGFSWPLRHVFAADWTWFWTGARQSRKDGPWTFA